MDDRKDYAAPAIAAEDVLEQTSLACQVSEPFPTTGQDTVFAPFLECATNVSKGGVFIDIEVGCTSVVRDFKQAVVLS
jgi:hypothetical protein